MSQARVAPMPSAPPPVPSLSRLHRTSNPREILVKAKAGAGPEDLMDRHGLSAQTLRRIISGYRPFERCGGSEKIWDQYYYEHEDEIRALWKPKVIW